MGSIGQYLLSILTAALISAVVFAVVSEKSPLRSSLKITCAIFLGITALSPLTDIKIDLSEYFSSLSTDNQWITDWGTAATLSEQKTIINESISAYILEKANSLNLDVTTLVEFKDDKIPIPYKIYIDGDASPYAKKELAQYITENIGISEEHQIWN